MELSSIGKTAQPMPLQPANAPGAAAPNRPGSKHGHHHAHHAQSLMDMLTPEELDFFQQMEALGPLTYSRNASTSPSTAAPLGQRVDLKG